VKTKEAIEKVKDKYEGWMGYARSQKEFDELEKERDEVISLLQQDEAYRQLVKELKEFYGNGTVENECGLGVKLFNLIEILEGKYFPKEEKDEN